MTGQSLPILDDHQVCEEDLAGSRHKVLAACFIVAEMREHLAIIEKHSALSILARQHLKIALDISEPLLAEILEWEQRLQHDGWADGAEATSEWMATYPSGSTAGGLPIDPPLNPFEAR